MPKNSGDYLRPLLGLAGLLFGTPVMILFFFVAYVVVFVIPWPLVLVAATAGICGSVLGVLRRRRDAHWALTGVAWMVLTQSAVLVMVELPLLAGYLA
ncbi:MAG TPA: hypothetical protein VIR33_03570 [Thermopolyspora sp.]